MNSLIWNEFKVGQEIQPLEKLPSFRQLLLWACAVSDYNPLHFDKEYAIACGFTDIVIQGQLVMAFLCQMLSTWHGGSGFLKQLEVSHKGVNFLGDKLICRGKVLSVHPYDKRVILEVWVENQGVKTVIGKATVESVALLKTT
ncbi:MAG: hypothetical protein FWH42_04050 [Dehalococcoidia bacterium]|nr:hypothetical protein [Dehalococcoidia bacterium]